MFGAYVYEKSSAEYEDLILLIDEDDLEEKTEYSSFFYERGFSIVRYKNDLIYRSNIEDRVKSRTEKILMIAKPGGYIPYDVKRIFRVIRISIAEMFPKLNATAIKDDFELDYNLLTLACKKNFSDLSTYRATKDFIRDVVKNRVNVQRYIEELCKNLNTSVSKAKNYHDWFGVAEKKAIIHVFAEQYGITVDIEETCRPFVDFVLKDFGILSSEIDADTPVLVSRVMEYMKDHSNKFVIIVMDGMSEFDWKIVSKSFEGIIYKQSHAMAMIPTVTSVSRQCLLSNKLPVQLENPWSQSKEKNEFIKCALKLGYTEAQICYERGYDADFGPTVSCAAIVINDVDDIVHGQLQGRTGMYNDISLLMKQGKLIRTVRRMLKSGFDVYISADHGNVPCVGMGKLMKSGVETETKSHRMVVLKDFADKDALLKKYPGLIDYPKYYLDKKFDYLICGIGGSLDAKGEKVMNHGGITIDEVIVPFIKIKAMDNNG